MKFYEIRHKEQDYPGKTVILKYKGYVIFKYKNNLLCYLKPLVKESIYIPDPEQPVVFISGYVVCKNDHLLFKHYKASSFIDGLKNLFNIKIKAKNKNLFI